MTEANGVLTFAQVEKIDDLPSERVQVEQWDGYVLVRHMSAQERADLEEEFASKKVGEKPGDFRKALLAKTLINADGSPWVTAEQIDALMLKNANAVERLFERSAEINAFRDKDVKELEGN